MNVQTITEMKKILAEKLHDENCYFTVKDIIIKKFNNGYTVNIKDYEHIIFTIYFNYDEQWLFQVTVENDFDDWGTWIDNKKVYDIKTALIRIGYRIGTTY